MAIDTVPGKTTPTRDAGARPMRASKSAARKLLMPLASLKLTVALFAMAIFIVLAGTLAQVDRDIWEVVNQYFRISPNELLLEGFPWINPGAAFAWIDFQLFFPPSFFPSRPQVPGGIFFPKGWLIGFVMAINLVAAHSLRFKMQARGAQLWGGLAVILLGAVTTWLVIASGSNKEGIQAVASMSWSTLWTLFKVGLGVVWLALGYMLIRLPAEKRLHRWLLAAVEVILGSVLLWILFQGEAARLGDSSMRILWQLNKAGFAGLVLLAGCLMLFRKRAGIVLLHGGIGLMMFSEVLVGTSAVEGQMVIDEGQAVNFVRDIRTLELAVVDPSDAKIDDVVVVPESMLLESLETGEPVQHEYLPFDVQVVEYLKNSRLRDVQPDDQSDDKNPADAGAGQTLIAVPVRPGTGTDADSAVDMASMYVRLTAKDGSELGNYLMSLLLKPQPIAVGGKTYDVSLRFKQMYKNFSMRLLDVRKDDYIGTDTPRNYSSDVHLVEKSANVDRKVHIWMNNPLRYAGETFYQSGYYRDPATGTETTTLQVVTNTGWMIPYVACMIVAVGMAAQFGIVLVRFLNRRSALQETAAEIVEFEQRGGNGKPAKRRAASDSDRFMEAVARWFPLFVVVVFAVYAGSKALTPSYDAGEMNLYEFGKIPIAYQGRVKPIDTLARNSLLIISGEQTFEDEGGETQPAIRWLLDVIARPEEARKHEVFQIKNMEVLDTLGLTRRSGSLYAVAEFQDNIEEFEKQAEAARQLDAEQLSAYQRKLLDLDKKIRIYTLISEAFRQPVFPPLPDPKGFEQNRDQVMQSFQAFVDAMRMERSRQAYLARFQPPLAVPVTVEVEDDPHAGMSELKGWLADRKPWETFAEAWTQDFVRQRIFNMAPNPATLALQDVFVAYAQQNARDFNRQVADYRAALAAKPPEGSSPSKTSFETFFNHFAPFYYSAVLYLVAFVLAAAAWLGWSKPLNRASFWLIVFTLALHTFALVARIYISGRPPVTNLYSSAVFIGWGAVVLGLILELIYRMGIGNVIAAVAGFATLLIAHFLAGDGDTFIVLQAVLDTQFWLATHVVCITMGYATTYVAGLLGILYIILGLFTPRLSPKVARDVSRMTYGTLCFAIFFSFVGTVLGGLWADDSWGRFWGWDPKENGALIIVLWNALVLHARWGGLVKERGLAVLAVAGNIAVSWSWFGVNELGVGLHSYGFTEGVLLALGSFVLSQLAIIGLGMLPKDRWQSFRAHREVGETAG